MMGKDLEYFATDMIRYTKDLFGSIPSYVYYVLLLINVFLFISYKVLKCSTDRGICIILLSEYFAMLLCYTILFRKSGIAYNYNFSPFWSYVAVMHGRYDLVNEIILNCLVFLPLGVILGSSYKDRLFKPFLIGAFISFVIEFLQLILRRGRSEVDDVLHNSLGCFWGICLVYISRFALRKNRVKE